MNCEWYQLRLQRLVAANKQTNEHNIWAAYRTRSSILRQHKDMSPDIDKTVNYYNVRLRHFSFLRGKQSAILAPAWLLPPSPITAHKYYLLTYNPNFSDKNFSFHSNNSTILRPQKINAGRPLLTFAWDLTKFSFMYVHPKILWPLTTPPLLYSHITTKTRRTTEENSDSGEHFHSVPTHELDNDMVSLHAQLTVNWDRRRAKLQVLRRESNTGDTS